jgi:hypothetical protein
MENGNGIGNNDAATLALLSGGGYGGGIGIGGRGYGGEYLSSSALADGTALREAVDCNSTIFSDGLNTLSSQFDNINGANRFDRLNENISDAEFRSDAKFTNLNKNISDSEFRTNRQK